MKNVTKMATIAALISALSNTAHSATQLVYTFDEVTEGYQRVSDTGGDAIGKSSTVYLPSSSAERTVAVLDNSSYTTNSSSIGTPVNLLQTYGGSNKGYLQPGINVSARKDAAGNPTTATINVSWRFAPKTIDNDSTWTILIYGTCTKNVDVVITANNGAQLKFKVDPAVYGTYQVITGKWTDFKTALDGSAPRFYYGSGAGKVNTVGTVGIAARAPDLKLSYTGDQSQHVVVMSASTTYINPSSSSCSIN